MIFDFFVENKLFLGLFVILFHFTFPTTFAFQEAISYNNRTCDHYQPQFSVLDYWYLGYCTFQANEALFVILLVLWFIFLIYLLLSTTENYFCAAISRMSARFSVSNHLISVTFLAFGNSTPEVMTAIIAVFVFGMYHNELSEKLGGSGGYIAVTTLIGSAMLCSTLLLAILAFFSNAQKQLHSPNLFPESSSVSRSYVRDMVMYLLTIVITFVVLITTELNLLYKGILLISFYLLYFVITLLARYIYERRKRKQRKDIGILDNLDDEILEMGNETDPYRIDDILYFTNRHQPHPVVPATRYTFAEEYSFSRGPVCMRRCLTSFYLTLASIGWQEKSWQGKLLFIVTFPLNILRVFTIPPINEYTWNKWHACAAAFGSPIFFLFALSSFFTQSDTSKEVLLFLYIAALCFGLILTFIVYFTVKEEQPPDYFNIFVFFGFLMSAVWLYIIVREILNVICLSVAMTGHYQPSSDYPSSLWGLHLLGWTTGLQDFVANLLIDSLSLPSMAVAASFAAPTFSFLFGLGLVFLIQGIRYFNVQHQQFIQMDNSLLVGFAFLTISAISNIIFIPLSKFTLNRKYALFLMLLYIAFVVISVLTDFRVIFAQSFL